MNLNNDPQGRIGWIDKFLSRKDYVGVTISMLIVAVSALSAALVYKDRRIDAIQKDFALERRAFQQREDTIRAEAKREVSLSYKKSFDDYENRVSNLEAIIEKLLNKSTSVDTKYERIQTQINAVSGNQKKIEQFIPKP